MEEISPYDVKRKDIIGVKLSFINKETGEQTTPVKRPCLVIQSTDDELICRTITSRTDNYLTKKYGVRINKNDENGLNKDSAVLCTDDNEVILNKANLASCERYGQITSKEHLAVMKHVTHCNRMEFQTKYTVNKGMQR
ncbi:type II toxin-antitoxin system PemK/MazF family toxin [Oceanobacillus sp. FSL K6-0251]|uniref:type II toxin-antitoxin system PemK/MazF family toxin n=1 Tax=Oceanobacillus sp. FSL K6-0251 TaxID=2921602 RepID=UPI0030F5A3FD